MTADPTADPYDEQPAGPSAPGPLALIGSGEYLPVMLDIERDLMAGRGARYVQLATAAAPEGDDSLRRWHSLGAQQAARLGAEQVVVDVRTREDAFDEGLATLVEGAALVYLSGGNPVHLAETLRGTPVWDAIRTAWQSGAALAGCSAGAMAMSGWVPSLRHPRSGAVDGLGVLPHVRVIPHFDRMAGWMPDIVARYLVPEAEGATVVGVDEDTALVGGPHEWTVRGRQHVWVLTHQGRTGYADGEVLVTP